MATLVIWLMFLNGDSVHSQVVTLDMPSMEICEVEAERIKTPWTREWHERTPSFTKDRKIEAFCVSRKEGR